MREKRDYYDEFYIDENVRKNPARALAFLSHKLQRFVVPADQCILELLSPGEKFLEIGCGTGPFALMVKSKFTEVYGVDISPVAIEKAKGKIANRTDADHFHFSVLDVDEGLPFKDSFFDAVVCIAVLEHLLSPLSVLKEIRRVLENAGELVVLVPNDAWLPYRLQLLKGEIPQSGFVDELGVDWGHLHKFNKRIAADLLRSTGYRVINVTCSGVFGKIRAKWLSLLSSNIIVKAIISE